MLRLEYGMTRVEKKLKPLEIQFCRSTERRLKLMGKETNTHTHTQREKQLRRNKWIRRTIALLLKNVFFPSRAWDVFFLVVWFSEKERATHVLLRNSMVSIIDRSIGSAVPVISYCLFLLVSHFVSVKFACFGWKKKVFTLCKPLPENQITIKQYNTKKKSIATQLKFNVWVAVCVRLEIDCRRW